jgi:hypothetical protein
MAVVDEALDEMAADEPSAARHENFVEGRYPR